LQSAMNKLESERAELESILAAGVLGRKNNLVRLLTFVCEKYFEGSVDEVKEYSIAVQALGRSADFDPQVDTIVRVTAHALRKRLEDYYRTDGSGHSVHIFLPPGHYAPKFIHKSDLEAALPVRVAPQESPAGHVPDNATHMENGRLQQQQKSLEPLPRIEIAVGLESKPKGYFPVRKLRLLAFVLSSICLLTAFWWYRSINGAGHDNRAQIQPNVTTAAIYGKALRALAGSDRPPYVDRSGFTWEKDRFCEGGSSFSVSGHAIQGTEDAQLFLTGRRGAIHCKYPIPPGIYEVHLLFAETAGILENARNVAFSINGGPTNNLDVVDEAGGNDMVTAKVLLDVAPASDGMIHLDFITPESFVNAVEILPGIQHRMLPVRIIAGPSIYSDSNGNVWMSDRYFFGGRVTRFGGDLSKIPDGSIYDWHRFGHFHYTVPVATGGTYTLKLYFMEHWFGVQSGAIGGVGSRVFDVSCNGIMLLKRFDIFREAGAGPLVKTFTHIEPTAQGKLEIYFTPAVNYPSISAIEVIPE
jgi:Malectin domain